MTKHDDAACADLVKSRGFCFDIECRCSCHTNQQIGAS